MVVNCPVSALVPPLDPPSSADTSVVGFLAISFAIISVSVARASACRVGFSRPSTSPLLPGSLRFPPPLPLENQKRIGFLRRQCIQRSSACEFPPKEFLQ